MSLELLYGCDPEVFLSNGNGFISAWGMFPGTKDKPYPVEKGAIQVDGFALEFNIEPAKTAIEFDNNVSTVLKQMEEMVKSVDKDLKLNFIPVAHFNKQYFDSLPEENKTLGCDPDYECVMGTANEIDETAKDNPFRTAAGHFHIGWTKDQDPFEPSHFQDCRYIANSFHYHGVNPIGMTALDNFDYRLESERLKLYGKNGAFRPKSYGVELRQYSNVWVKESSTRLRMFNFIDKQVRSLYRG